MRVKPTPASLLLDVDSTAEALSVCPLTVRSLIKSGKLCGVRVGKRVLVSRESVQAFIAANVILAPVSETGKGHASA